MYSARVSADNVELMRYDCGCGLVKVEKSSAHGFQLAFVLHRTWLAHTTLCVEPTRLRLGCRRYVDFTHD
jgi:hypothetical protein